VRDLVVSRRARQNAGTSQWLGWVWEWFPARARTTSVVGITVHAEFHIFHILWCDQSI